jgi:putative endonuclease
VPAGPVVYLLRCADGSLYCGWTLRLEARLSAHRSGRGSKYVASRLPFELAAVLPMADRTSAMREEARIKRLTRAKKDALLKARPRPGARPPRRRDRTGSR